jgi:hypothetical protein
MKGHAIGGHAGVAGHEKENFSGVTEPLVAQCQPAQIIVGDVIEEDKPQCKAAA